MRHSNARPPLYRRARGGYGVSGAPRCDATEGQNSESCSGWKIGNPENRKCGKVIPAGVAFLRLSDAAMDRSTHPPNSQAPRGYASDLKTSILWGGEQGFRMKHSPGLALPAEVTRRHPLRHIPDTTPWTRSTILQEQFSIRAQLPPEIRKSGELENASAQSARLLWSGSKGTRDRSFRP